MFIAEEMTSVAVQWVKSPAEPALKESPSGWSLDWLLAPVQTSLGVLVPPGQAGEELCSLRIPSTAVRRKISFTISIQNLNSCAS